MTVRQTKITFNTDGLDNLVKKMGQDLVTRVGVLGSGNARSDDSAYGNAGIGLVHEFGSISGKIPQRSFLRLPLQTKSKDFMKAISSGSAKAAFDAGDYKKVYAIMGVKAEEIIQEAFASGGFGQWAALEDSTVARKGSSVILIEENELRKSITSDVVNRSSVQ